MAHSLRSLGSAALNFALVAQGGMDIYWLVTHQTSSGPRINMQYWRIQGDWLLVRIPCNLASVIEWAQHSAGLGMCVQAQSLHKKPVVLSRDRIRHRSIMLCLRRS